MFRTGRREMYDSALLPLVKAGQCDKAYYAACRVCDFGHAKPWRFIGKSMPKVGARGRVQRAVSTLD